MSITGCSVVLRGVVGGSGGESCSVAVPVKVGYASVMSSWVSVGLGCWVDVLGVTGSCCEFEVSGLFSMGGGGAEFDKRYLESNEKLSYSSKSLYVGKGAGGCAGNFVVFAQVVEGSGSKSCMLSEAVPSAGVGALGACLLLSGVLFCLLFDSAYLFCAVFIFRPLIIIIIGPFGLTPLSTTIEHAHYRCSSKLSRRVMAHKRDKHQQSTNQERERERHISYRKTDHRYQW